MTITLTHTIFYYLVVVSGTGNSLQWYMFELVFVFVIVERLFAMHSQILGKFEGHLFPSVGGTRCSI
jgi:hypothetical protein